MLFQSRMYYACNRCNGVSTDLPNGNGTWPIFGIQLSQFAGILLHFWPDEYRLHRKAELMASVQHKLHKLLAMHSTLPLVTAYVALPLVGKLHV